MGTITAMLHHPRRPLLCWALVECCHMSSGQGTLPFHPPRRKFKKVAQGKKMLAPPAGLPPLLRGDGGHCWYPVDWVPPRTSFKSSQGAERAPTRYHASCGSASRLPTKEGSIAITRPVSPYPTSPSGRASLLPHVMQHRSPPPCSGGH
jgi:hypothetical protein